MNNIFWIKEIVITPITFFFIYCIALFVTKKYRGTPYFNLFFKGLYIKLFFGSLGHFAYHYFLSPGDTFIYYDGSTRFYEVLYTYPLDTIKSIFQSPSEYAPHIRSSMHQYYSNPEEGLLIKIISIIGFATFNSFLSTGLWVSFIAYGGTWRLFKLFNQIYPKFTKPLSFITLFFPSIVFWSSSISKDALTMGGLGFLTYAFYKLLIKLEFKFSHLIIVLIFGYIIAIIKGYILVALLPGLILWVFFEHNSKIKNNTLRKLSTPFIILLVSVSGILLIQTMKNSPMFNEYTSEETVERVVVIYNYLNDPRRNIGSAYSIGELEPTISGLLSAFPKAINVSLYRPYLWEVHNLPMLIAALESLLTLILSLIVLLKIGFLKSIRKILSTPILLFSLLFVLVFAGAVGLTSGNFGTLMRYKIPCLPFYYLILVVLYKNHKPSLE